MNDNQKFITVNTDGASKGNPGKARIGIFITNSEGKTLIEYSKYLGDNITNNVSEYSAIIKALDLIIKLKEEKKIDFNHIKFITDSKLVVEQISNRWKVKHPHMKFLYKTFNEKWEKDCKSLGLTYEISHILRDKNTEADLLSNHSEPLYIKEYI
jgi:ribonuclease HI